jgi:hypothetical protein
MTNFFFASEAKVCPAPTTRAMEMKVDNFISFVMAERSDNN